MKNNPLNSLFSKIKNNQLISGTIIVFIGSTVSSGINYLYHMLLGRMLGPVDYGIFSSLISLTYIYGIPVSVMTLVSLKYVSSLREGKNPEAAIGFYHWFAKKLIWFGLICFVVSIAVTPLVTNFLHLSSFSLVILINLFSVVSIYNSFGGSVLQGFLRFDLNTISSIVTSFLKIALALLSLYLGFRVNGVLFSLFFVFILSLFLLVYFIKTKIDFSKKKIVEVKIPFREILKYGFPVFLSTLALTSLYTTDILLVKNLFSEKEAGFYASLAILGKVVFFASSSINLVMFPLVSGKKAKGENYKKVFLTSFFLVFLASLILVLIYFAFPKQMINLLFGKEYLEIAPNLGYFAVFMAFYSLASLTVNFFLALSRLTMIVLPLTAAASQVILIILFHQSLSQVVMVNIFVLGLLVVSLLAVPLKNYVKLNNQKFFIFRKRQK